MQPTPEDASPSGPADPVQRRFTVRRYQPGDREVVRTICCNTGFLGKPVDPLFQDRELFADYLTSYYTDYEPESSFVIVKDGAIRGYLMGSRRPFYNDLVGVWKNAVLACKGFWRYFAAPYNAASRKFVAWILTQAWKEVPIAPKNTPHFHINLLEDVRSVAETHDLIQAYLTYLHESGEKAVYGQMVVFENRRTERMFSRYGFAVLDKKEVTKYRDLYGKPVYLFTVLKDLKANPNLYSGDRSK